MFWVLQSRVMSIGVRNPLIESGVGDVSCVLYGVTYGIFVE